VYQYNATKTRWEKVLTGVSSVLNATISINYHGYPDAYKYAGNVIVTATWNQPVSSFTTSNLSIKGTTGYNFTLLSSSNSSTFQFSLSYLTATTSTNGIQIYIPAGSVSALSDSTVVNNFPIFSPGFVFNVSKPLALLSMVYKTNIPVYSIISTTTGITYYFSTVWPGPTTTNAIRVKTDFKNPPTGTVSVPTGATTSTFSYIDINAVTIVGSGSITIPSGDYTTFNGTTAAARATNPRYIDFYYGSDPGANQIVSITVPAGRYTDGSTSIGIYNTDSAPMYFGLLTYAARVLSSVATKNVGDRTFTIAVNFDYFTPLLASLPSTATVTLSTGSSLSNVQISPTAQTGNQLIMQYIPKNTTTDYTETLTFPVGWATFSGTSTNIIKDPANAATPFTTRSTVNAFTASFDVIVSSPTITSTPANGATGVTATSVQLNFNRIVNSVGSKYYQVTSGGSTVQGNTLIPSAVNTNTTVISLPAASLTANTSYSVTIDAGAYQDIYYNLSVATTVTFVTTSTAPVGQRIILSNSTWTVPLFINRISVLAVSQGAGGGSVDHNGQGGGTLAWRNCVVVNPGDVLSAVIGTNVRLGTATASGYYLNVSTGVIPSNVCGYGLGGCGGSSSNLRCGGGGGGAGGYGGAGGGGGTTGNSAASSYGGGAGGRGNYGNINSCDYYGGDGGGGVGIYGLGSTGIGVAGPGAGGSGGAAGDGKYYSCAGAGGAYGGGGGGAGYVQCGMCRVSGLGGPGVIRIVYGKVNGAARQFPSTNVASATT
jgi:hypothetical protein